MSKNWLLIPVSKIEPGLFGEMSDSRTGKENVQDEPGVFVVPESKEGTNTHTQ